jgi:hypothetical protein
MKESPDWLRQYVHERYNAEHSERDQLSKEEMNYICDLCDAGLSEREIAQRFNAFYRREWVQ